MIKLNKEFTIPLWVNVRDSWNLVGRHVYGKTWIQNRTKLSESQLYNNIWVQVRSQIIHNTPDDKFR